MAVMRTLGMRHHARNLKQEAVTKPPDPGWNKKTRRVAYAITRVPNSNSSSMVVLIMMISI